MRIIALADTHLFQADLGSLPPGDILVHAADLMRGRSLDELRSIAHWLRDQSPTSPPGRASAGRR